MSLEKEYAEDLEELSSFDLDESEAEEIVKPVKAKNSTQAKEVEMQKEAEATTQNDGMMELESLIQHGIGTSDLSKLKAGGVCSVKAVHMSTKRNLCKIKGISEVKVDKIKEAASKMMSCSFVSASDFLMKRKSVLRLSTGSYEFDKLLGGGVQTMSITEAFGEFRTGKTQIAHTLCVTCQLPANMGGGGGKAAYIDTEGTFRPERIKEIATRFNLESDAVLDNIIYARAYNSEHQYDLLNELAKRFMEEKCFKLLVVDSIIALFRTDFSGRGELGERQQKLNQFLSKLIKIADEFNLAVFITNQMSSDPGAVMSFVSDPKKPVGGHVLAHASTTRLSLKKGRAEERIVKIYDSPDVPEAEARYTITKGGIADLTD